MSRNAFMAASQRREKLLNAQRERVAQARKLRAERENMLAAVMGVTPPDWSQLPQGREFCSPKTARCKDSRDYSKERRRCCWWMVHEVLRVTTDALNAAGIPWWADYGTLLAAVSTGGFCPWDKDSDLGVLQTDKRRVLDLELPLTRMGLGFSGGIRRTVKVTASRANQTNCDIFSWHLERGNWSRYVYAGVDDHKGKEFPESWLFPLTVLDFDGITLYAPASVRWPGETPAPHIPGFERGSLFLEFRYGPGWMHPRRANNDVEWNPRLAAALANRAALCGQGA